MQSGPEGYIKDLVHEAVNSTKSIYRAEIVENKDSFILSNIKAPRAIDIHRPRDMLDNHKSSR
jgi:hypothetical protein